MPSSQLALFWTQLTVPERASESASVPHLREPVCWRKPLEDQRAAEEREERYSRGDLGGEEAGGRLFVSCGSGAKVSRENQPLE